MKIRGSAFSGALPGFTTLILSLFFLAGCAGPTTPFGAISIKNLIHAPHDGNDDDGSDGSDDDDGDDTEVAKKSNTASGLLGEVKIPTAPQTVVVLGNTAPATSVSTAVNPPRSSPPAVAATSSVAASNVAMSNGTVTLSGPVVNRSVSTASSISTGSTSPNVGAGISAAAATTTAAYTRVTAQYAAQNQYGQPVHYGRPKITFTPKRQILHAGTTFDVLVDDPEGIPTNYEIMLLYNGIDLTSKFMMQAEETFEGHPATKLKLSFDHLHLLPDRDNKVEVVYWHSHNDRPSYASFFPPHCSAFKQLKIATTGDFEVSTKLLDKISNEAVTHHLNPTYVAGLIAQESAFNERAVSTAKAIGLTQITGSGEAQVIKGNDDWPRYPNVNRLPASIVKFRVMAGKINANNEWRLNPDLSVKGGADYISYLNDYWRKPINYGLVANNFHDPDFAITELILASYNSGPSRVNAALQNHGRRWLRDDEELGEARKYVKRVMSFCDFFSKQEEDTNDDAP